MGRDLSKEMQFQLENAGFSGFGDSLGSGGVSQAIGNFTPQQHVANLMAKNQMNRIRARRDAEEGNYGLLGAMMHRSESQPGGVHFGKASAADDAKFQGFNKQFVDRYMRKHGDLPKSVKDAFEGNQVSVDWKEDEHGNMHPFVKFGDREISGDILVDLESDSSQDFMSKYGKQEYDARRAVQEGALETYKAEDQDYLAADTDEARKELLEKKKKEQAEELEKYASDWTAGFKEKPMYGFLDEYLPYIVSGKGWESRSLLDKLTGKN